jgi:putative ABC transport system permease protein
VAGWIQDLKHAVRSVASAKRFAGIVIATLGLGIGANTAVFGVLNAVVLQPLPYDEPDRLVRVYRTRGEGDEYWPGPAVVELRERNQTVDMAAVYTYAPEGADLTDRAQPERVKTLRVSADYFRVLRVQPIVGRFFERTDERTGTRVAVVRERIWREYLGGTAESVGRLLSLNATPFQVIGVVPDTFEDPMEPEAAIWSAISLEPGGSNSWGNNYLSVLARLEPGATIAQAQAELAAMAAGLPWTSQTRYQNSARVARLHADTIGCAGAMLWILLGAVAVLLLIACVNVASLSLARGTARASEMAVRAAIGCSRWRLARQLLIESLVLSIAGGLAGLALAVGLTRTLLASAPDTVAQVGNASLEITVFAFSLAVAVLAGIAFGVAPALQFTRPNLENLLRESGRTGSGSRRHTHVRNALVICQIALALVLLSGAGLLLRSFDRLRTLALGVKPEKVVTFQVHLPSGRYQDPAARARFHLELERRITALPGVHGAGAISRLPVTGTYHSWGTLRDDAPQGTRSVQPEQRTIEGAYFAVMGIPLLRGRTFSTEDESNVPRRVVISRELAEQLFRGDDPIGRRLRVLNAPVEIIGVVGDVAISRRGLTRPTVYHSHRQFAVDRNWALTQVVAVDRPTPTLLEDIRRELAAIDPALVLYQPRMLADVVGAGIAHERFALQVVAGFAGLALVLAAVGIYGVLSYTVTRRRREMGIRMALGAQTRAVWSMVLQDGGRLAAMGVGLGLAGAYAATRTLQSLLFDVSPTDPVVFAAAATTLAAVALIASWIPARAATRVDPIQAVRMET